MCAGLFATSSTFVTHRLWAGMSVGVYAFAAVAAWLTHERWPERRTRIRVGVSLFVLLGTVIAPLGLAVVLRATSGSEFTHDETITTERAGVSLIQGSSPYAHGATPEGAQPRRFPYLPLMALHGLPRAMAPSWIWSDARVVFCLVALLLVGSALLLWPGSVEARLRAFQVTLLLPTAAMCAVAGGDDLPVLALMLLALVLKATERRAACAVAVSCAALMKATAWPLWLILAATELNRARATGELAARPTVSVGPARRSGAEMGPRTTRWALAAYLLLPLAMAAAVMWDGSGLIGDTMLFPLGLVDRVPNDTVTQWQAIRNIDAGLSRLAGLLLVAAAAGVAVRLATTPRRPNPDPSAMAALLASVVTCTALAVAPARPGLWAYPLELALWGLLLPSNWNAELPTALLSGGGHVEGR